MYKNCTIPESAWLLNHAENVFSQFGEDGVIQAALSILPSRDYHCVEFGAWDGLHLSNTANLIRSHNFSGVFIEADATKVKELLRNYKSFSKVTCIEKMVGWTSESGLDSILENTDVPADFDLLSIDIDGNDFFVWQAVEKYRPKLVIIEFNQTIPTEVRYLQPKEQNTNIGASIASLVELANSKNYELISVLRNNLLFVVREHFPLFHIEDNRASNLRVDFSDVTWLFFGMDGSLHLEGSKKIPWHDLQLNKKSMQPLPNLLRRFPPRYNGLQLFLCRCLRWWRRKP